MCAFLESSVACRNGAALGYQSRWSQKHSRSSRHGDPGSSQSLWLYSFCFRWRREKEKRRKFLRSKSHNMVSRLLGKGRSRIALSTSVYTIYALRSHIQQNYAGPSNSISADGSNWYHSCTWLGLNLLQLIADHRLRWTLCGTMDENNVMNSFRFDRLRCTKSDKPSSPHDHEIPKLVSSQD